MTRAARAAVAAVIIAAFPFVMMHVAYGAARRRAWAGKIYLKRRKH